MSIEFVRDVLALGDGFNDTGDLWETIWWRTDREYAPVTFFVTCNDLFYWGAADAERLTPENIAGLRRALVDVREAFNVPTGGWPSGRDMKTGGWDEWWSAGGWAAQLFSARVRAMRPQRPCYRSMPDKLKPLFDACGPERDPKDEG